jgi:hypothetical protein
MEQGTIGAPAELRRFGPLSDARALWENLPALVLIVLSLLLVVLQVSLSSGIVDDTGYLGAHSARLAIGTHALLVALTALAALLAPRRLLWLALVPGGLALAASSFAVAFAGLEIWSMAAACLTLTAAWMVGRWLLSVRWLREEGLHEKSLVALTVGLGVLSLVVLVLGRAGLLHWWIVGLATCVLGALGAIRLVPRRSPGRGLQSITSSPFRAAAAGIIALQGAFAVIWAGAPEVQYDALWYKAWLPQLWAYDGRIDGSTFTDHPYISIAGLMQLVAVPGHTLDAHGVGRYLELAFGIVIVVTVWRLGNRIGQTVGPVAALVVAMAPLVIWESATAYEELGLAVLVLGAATAVVHYDDHPVGRPFAVSLVVGFLAGVCITGKLHLLPFALGVGLGWLLVSAGARDLGKRLAGYAAGVLLAALPLLAFRWLETGNPVLPYFNNIFKSPHFRTDEGITDFIVSRAEVALRFPSAEIPQHWGPRWLRLPWRLIHDSSPYTEVAAAGVLGLLIPVVIVAVLFGWRGRPGSRVVWGALVLALVAWYLKFQYLRFLLPLAILGVFVALPLLGGLDGLVRRRLATSIAVVVAAVAATAFFVSTAASFWNVPDDKLPLSAAVGRESESSYERRSLLDAPAFEYLNAHAERGAKIIGNGYARTLLRSDLDFSPPWELGDRLTGQGRFTSNPDEVKRAFDEEGVGWVVLGEQERLLDVEGEYLAPAVERYGQIVFADHLRDVYRVVDAPAPVQPVPLCDGDISHPECWAAQTPPDTTPGLTDAEVGSGPVSQTVPACPGATYALSVTTGPGSDDTVVFFTFGQPDPEQGVRYLFVPPGKTSVFHQTAPADAETLTIVLDTTGPTASVERLGLAVADTSLRGSPCP